MKQNFYLIQRGTFATNVTDEITGLFGSVHSGKLISCDYMGAAEFEWGAIPHAYKRIMYRFNEYKLHVTDLVTVRGVPFCIFCRDEYYPVVLEMIKEYIKKPYPLKEYSNLREPFVTNDDHRNTQNTNFWWCIDRRFVEGTGDWMAFTGAADRQNAFMKVMTENYQNWYMKIDEKIRKKEYAESWDW